MNINTLARLGKSWAIRTLEFIIALFRWVFDFSALLTFAFWLVPLRNFCERHRWGQAVQICNGVPNFLTVFRGVTAEITIPILAYFIWFRESKPAWIVFGIVFALFYLDAIDGPLARRLDHITEFGKEKDPLMDKLVLGTALIAVVVLFFQLQGMGVGVVVTIFVAVLVAIESMVGFAGIQARNIALSMEMEINGAFMPGKIKGNLEAYAVTYGFAILIARPDSTLGAMVFTLIIVLAYPAAILSMKAHQGERREFQRLLENRVGVVQLLPGEEAAS